MPTWVLYVPDSLSVACRVNQPATMTIKMANPSIMKFTPLGEPFKMACKASQHTKQPYRNKYWPSCLMRYVITMRCRHNFPLLSLGCCFSVIKKCVRKRDGFKVFRQIRFNHKAHRQGFRFTRLKRLLLKTKTLYLIKVFGHGTRRKTWEWLGRQSFYQFCSPR